MPIPFLPFDVIAEIVSHEEEDIDCEQQISIGKSASLVCSTWRPLGQALRWRRVGIPPEQIPSLTDHFAHHPHLVSLIRIFRITKDTAESSGSLFGRQLPDLLRSFLNLRDVTLAGKLGEDLSKNLEVLSRVKDLKRLELLPTDKLGWTSEVASIFRRGFRQLSRLGLMVQRVEFPAQADTAPLQSGGCIPVRVLIWALNGNSAQGSRLAQELFSTFNLNTVRSVFLTPAAYYHSSEQLLLCPNLSRLDISCPGSIVSPTFSSIVAFLPRFPSLHRFKIIFVHKDGPQQVQSPVSLSAVLASFPPSLKRFQAQQFVFPDFETLPLRQISTPEDYESPTLTALYPLDAEQTETSKLTIWKKQGDAGRTRWYREVDSENDDEGNCQCYFHSFVSLSAKKTDGISSEPKSKSSIFLNRSDFASAFKFNLPRFTLPPRLCLSRRLSLVR